jgi:hypothetical protein
MDARELIKQKKRKTVYAAIRDDSTRLKNCSVTGCTFTGECTIQFKSHEEKMNYDKGKKLCCPC